MVEPQRHWFPPSLKYTEVVSHAHTHAHMHARTQGGREGVVGGGACETMTAGTAVTGVVNGRFRWCFFSVLLRLCEAVCMNVIGGDVVAQMIDSFIN